MPIPFRDATELDELGAAAYLTIDEHPAGYMGAFFLVNARGEPLEFTYTRIETPHTFLWRQEDIRRHAARKITSALLSLCPLVPRLILCRAEEIGSELFCQDIQLSIPVCRVAPKLAVVPYTGQEARDESDTEEPPLHIFWFPDRPPEESPEQKLFRHLDSHRLLVEPFQRAAVGLSEVYKADFLPKSPAGQAKAGKS